MNNVWMKSGALLMYGASIDAQSHMHNAVQIIWPSGQANLHVAGQDLQGAVVIDANVPHQLQMSQGWVVLVEPQSQLGEDLKGVLNGEMTYVLDAFEPFYLHEGELILEPLQALLPLFQALFTSVQGEADLAGYIQLVNRAQLDVRIETLLNRLNMCFDGACLKPEKWKAVQVAKSVALSESRFLHLFKAQMGIAWRPFLLWRRMLCAVNLLAMGEAATHAAYVAGFSDSAHLSRSFRAMFGLSIRQASQIFPRED